MPETFQSIHINAASVSDADMQRAGARTLSVRGGPTRGEAPVSIQSDEAAARFYLSSIFAGDLRPAVRGLTAPESPQVVPDLKLRDSKPSPLTRTTSVRFVQTRAAVPIFGSGRSSS